MFYIAQVTGTCSPVHSSDGHLFILEQAMPDYDWERVDFWVNEGPAVMKADGKIFVTYSASAAGVCYCMGMMSAAEDAGLLDPSYENNRINP